MTKTTFHPLKFREDIVQPYNRDENGVLQQQPLPLPLEPVRETAGHGVWGSCGDYAKLLIALLDGGGPILSPKSVQELFVPQDLNTNDLNSMVHGPYKPTLGPLIPDGAVVRHGLAGLVNTTAFPGRRAVGTLQWSGMPNLTWVSASVLLVETYFAVIVLTEGNSGSIERAVLPRPSSCSSCRTVTPRVLILPCGLRRPCMRLWPR